MSFCFCCLRKDEFVDGAISCRGSVDAFVINDGKGSEVTCCCNGRACSEPMNKVSDRGASIGAVFTVMVRLFNGIKQTFTAK